MISNWQKKNLFDVKSRVFVSDKHKFMDLDK